MRVLVACEFSGRVRDAFLALGHEALSCDLLPSESPGPHYQGDVMDILHDGWDMMIAFPPCTYLAVSGNRWMNNPQFPDRHLLRRAAMQFFYDLYTADIPRIALENPRSVMSNKLCKPTQCIQPWMFGHREQKSTYLWLRNLPRLRRTRVVSLPDDKRLRERIFQMGPSETRQRDRSRTYEGVALAMAQQWGRLDAR